MNYSMTIGGIVAAVALPLLVQAGFTDQCSNEITAKVLPYVSALPGLVAAYFGRVRHGDVTLGGFKKKG